MRLTNLSRSQDRRVLNRGARVHPINRANVSFRGGIRL